MSKQTKNKKNSKYALPDEEINNLLANMDITNANAAKGNITSLTQGLAGGALPDPSQLPYVNTVQLAQSTPLPSVAGGNATPAINAQSQPVQPSFSYSSNAASYNETRDMNKAERDAAMAKQEAANAVAKDYNENKLPTLMAQANAMYKGATPSLDKYGEPIRMNPVPVLPQAIIPEKIDIPNMVTGHFGESFKEASGNRNSSGPKPKIDTNIPLFFRDPNGQIRVGWDDYQSGKAEKLSGDPLQIKWNNIEDLRSIRKDWTAKQFENEGAGLQSGWKIKTLKGSNGKQPSVADASGNFFDIARASALSELAINRPDAVVTKDGKPLNQTSSTQFRLNPNNLFATATVTNEDGTTSKVQYLADKNAYPIIMDGISKALSDNGWKNGEIPKGKFWNNLKSSLKLAYKEPGGEARGGTSRDQFVRAIYSYIMSENQ